MPGIAGIISTAPPERCTRLVRDMTRALQHDRPELFETGIHSCPETGAYVGWAAHSGSFAANQSGLDTSAGTRLAFAGECFSHDGVDLPDANQALMTIYRSRGISLIPQLNGLFSGLLIDDKLGQAVLFNDRYGVERIYFHERSDELFFASEAKALLRVLPELRALDDNAVAEFINIGSVGDNRTLFRGIGLLPGGSAWSFRKGRRLERQRYFDPARLPERPPLPVAAFTEAFTAAFRKVMPRYARPTGSVAVSITGGLDTRMIMSCLPPNARPVCYTYAGSAGETLDTTLGRKVAALCGLDHRTLRLDRKFFEGFATLVDRAVYASDGTAGATMAHELYLSEIARRLAPVRLTGNYGGEVLRRVSTYKPIGLEPSLFASDFLRSLERERATEKDRKPGPSWAAFREVPFHLVGLRAIAASMLTLRTPFLDNELVDLALQASPACLATPRPALSLVHACKPELAAMSTDRGVRWPGAGPVSLARRALSEVFFKLDYIHAEGTRASLQRPLGSPLGRHRASRALHPTQIPFVLVLVPGRAC